MMPPKSLLKQLEAYFLRYLAMPDDYAFTAALWVAMTYIWPELDTIPYLVITSMTKRSGKTLLAELMTFASSNARQVAGLTAAVTVRLIREEMATLFIDEAETLSGSGSNDLRSMLNVGYKSGQTWPRTRPDGGIEHWPVFCPKCFILIGDVTDTLRDRSIVLRMSRAAPEALRGVARFVSRYAESEGSALGAEIQQAMKDSKDKILSAYLSHKGLDFLAARDAEIWLCLFAICEVLEPSRIPELRRVAMDLSTEKTAESRKHSSDEMAAAEKDANESEYAERLLRDLHSVMGRAVGIYSADALKALHEIDVAPWRKFRGVGLTALDMGTLLDRFGLQPKLIRTGKKKTASEKVARGYRRDDVEKAIREL